MKIYATKKLLKILLFLSVCFFYNSSYAQQFTTYLDEKGAETTDKNKRAIIRTIAVDPAVFPLFIFKEHFVNGQLYREGFVNSIQGDKFEGKLVKYNKKGGKLSEELYEDNNLMGEASYYYDNGQLKKEVNYLSRPKETRLFNFQDKYMEVINYYDSLGNIMVENGNGFLRMNGTEETYDEGEYRNKHKHGQWKGVFCPREQHHDYVEVFENGELISGEATDKNGKKYSYTIQRIEPEYKGGIKALYNFIGGNFYYPVEARKNKVQGRVLISFVVDFEGKVTKASIKKDIGYGCGKEGLRVVNRLKNWNPGVFRGVPVNVEYTLPIVVNL